MTIKVKEWLQRTWTKGNVDLENHAGDFDSLTGLALDLSGRKLERLPDWTALSTVPVAASTYPDDLYTAFADVGTEPIVFIGEYSSNLVSVRYVSGSYWTTANLTAAVTSLGGRDGQNVLWWGGHLYVIGSDKNVYRGASYTGALAAFYSGTDARVLVPWGDRAYLVTESGQVLNVNDADAAFESFYTPLDTIDVLFATPYRGYLLICAIATDGSLVFYRLTRSAILDTMATATNIPYTAGSGHLFAHHDDQIYFIPHGYLLQADEAYTVDIYRFDGTHIEYVSRIALTSLLPASSGLLSWQNKLVFYSTLASQASTGHVLKFLEGDSFQTLPAVSTGSTDLTTPFLASLGGQLILGADQGQSNGVLGFHALGGGAIVANTALDDGRLQTSYLDMGHPGKAKRLDTLTVVMDGKASDFTVTVKYRKDDTTTWTTATTSTNARHVTVSGLGVEFYVIQIRVELSDTAHSDLCIEAISAIYTVDN